MGVNGLLPLNEFNFDDDLLRKLTLNKCYALEDLVPNCSLKDLKRFDFLNRAVRRSIQAKLKLKKIILQD